MNTKEATSKLIEIAGTLLHSKLPSDLVDDYPQKTYSAAAVARMMEPAHDQHRLMAIQLRQIVDSLKEATK